MELPGGAFVASGIAAIISGSMILRLIVHFKRPRESKGTPKPEDGQDRAAQREEHWYALDEPMRIDMTPFEWPIGASPDDSSAAWHTKRSEH